MPPVTIAGISFAVNGPVEWAPFHSSGAVDVVIHIHELLRPPHSGARSMPAIERSNGRTRIFGEDFEAEASDGVVHLYQAPGRYPVEAVVKVLLADRLLQKGGLLLHAVGVASRRAAVLVGPSGAGKSTLGRICRQSGLRLLADELVAVWPEPSGWVAEGTPWNVGSPVRAVVDCVGLLEWDEASYFTSAPPGQVIRVLLPNALMPDASPVGRALMFRAASRLLEAVRSVRLYFVPDASAAEAVQSALS